MTRADEDEIPLASRFRLIDRANEGLLLNVQTGQFHQLNATALSICVALLAGESNEAAARKLAAEFRISFELACSDVQSIAELLLAAPRIRNRNAVWFEGSRTQLVMHIGETPSVRIAVEQNRLGVRLIPTARAPTAVVLQWAVPHLLTLINQPVLHASAVCHGGRTLAFSGASGAGKTTLARSFVAHGASPISEDLAVLSEQNGVVRIHEGAEAAIHDWVRSQTRTLASGGVVDGCELKSVVQGSLRPLDALLLVDAARRGGDVISLDALSEIEAIAALLENSFAEIGTTEIFARVFEASAAVARGVPAARCTAPGTLSGLDKAVASHNWKTAS